MLTCDREMEVCRVVNARKVQRKKQRDDLEARIAQRRSSPIQSRVSNGTAFDETGLDSRNDRIGAARKRARAMVIPNSGVVASVIASSVKRQSRLLISKRLNVFTLGSKYFECPPIEVAL